MGRVLKLKSSNPEPALLDIPPDDSVSPSASEDADAADSGGAARSSGVAAPAGASGLTGLPGALSEEDFDDDYVAAVVEAEEAGKPPPPKPEPAPEPRPVVDAAGELEDTVRGKGFRTADGSLWTIAGIGHPASPNQIDLKYMNDRAYVTFKLEGNIRTKPGDSLAKTLTDPRSTLIDPTLDAALERLRATSPPELDDARKCFMDLEAINLEKLDLDDEEAELRARRRRLTAPGVVRGKIGEVVALDKRLVEITDRREVLRLEKIEVDKQYEVLTRALAERARLALDNSAQDTERHVRGDLSTANGLILRALAPVLNTLVAAHLRWRGAANFRDTATARKENADEIVRRLIEPIKDGTEEVPVEKLLDRYQREEAEASNARGA